MSLSQIRGVLQNLATLADQVPLTLSVSQRGVVFLRDQDVTPTEMKDLMLRITELAGCVSAAFLPSSRHSGTQLSVLEYT